MYEINLEMFANVILNSVFAPSLLLLPLEMQYKIKSFSVSKLT